MKSDHQSFTGKAYWLYARAGGTEEDKGSWGEARIIKAILREKGTELAIECDCSTPLEPWFYTITLNRTVGNLFEGSYKAGRNPERQHIDAASGMLFSAAEGAVLNGTWHEHGENLHWLAVLVLTK